MLKSSGTLASAKPHQSLGTEALHRQSQAGPYPQASAPAKPHPSLGKNKAEPDPGHQQSHMEALTTAEQNQILDTSKATWKPRQQQSRTRAWAPAKHKQIAQAAA
eukprot:805350-Pelagomonas_calceolata.AAC.11